VLALLCNRANEGGRALKELLIYTGDEMIVATRVATVTDWLRQA